MGGGGGCIFIYSCSARRISFEMKLKRNLSEQAHEDMNIHPPINAQVTPLTGRKDGNEGRNDLVKMS